MGRILENRSDPAMQHNIKRIQLADDPARHC